jgi:hypothetical protein
VYTFADCFFQIKKRRVSLEAAKKVAQEANNVVKKEELMLELAVQAAQCQQKEFWAEKKIYETILKEKEDKEVQKKKEDEMKKKEKEDKEVQKKKEAEIKKEEILKEEIRIVMADLIESVEFFE